MTCVRPLAMVAALVGALALPSAVAAQGTNGSSTETRPATTTFLGDTGLWFVPTGETLPAKRFSAAGFFINHDFSESFTDVAEYSGNFGYGVTDRIELFGRVPFHRRIDSDARPPAVYGAPMDFPYINDGWQTGFGDINIGAKFNLLAPYRRENRGPAVAVRAAVKLPTSSDDDGLGTGKTDFMLDAIVSKELNGVELSGFGGFMFRGQPDDIELSNGLRWGVGFAAPTRSRLRFVGELFGESYFDSTVTAAAPRRNPNLPASWDVDSPVNLFLGVDWFTGNGLHLGTGLKWTLNHVNRDDFAGAESEGGDALGVQFRIGYHPGVNVWVAPPPPPPPPSAPAPAANRPPTVKARCEPCTTEVGKSVTVAADANDPDGDTLSYKWSAPAGTFGNAADRQTTFTCPGQPGGVPVTVTVTDGKGGTASDTVTIQCVQPPKREYKFEDVHFDFDRYSLRPEATRILDEAIKAMQADNTLRLTVEGHTCNIGTAEYNLALGERRSNAVREYLVGRGIGADRLNSVSYGEERPKHDNSREETRRLNRRAALTVRLQ
jgi:outer membrane protein OmpA-like peptidoglycan-associated protein